MIREPTIALILVFRARLENVIRRRDFFVMRKEGLDSKFSCLISILEVLTFLS